MNINLILVWVMSQAGLLPKIEAGWAAIEAGRTPADKLAAGQALEVLLEGRWHRSRSRRRTTPPAVADAHAKMGECGQYRRLANGGASDPSFFAEHRGVHAEAAS